MGRVGHVGHQIRWRLSRLGWYIGSVMGDTHYRRYLDYRRRAHPGEPVLTESEYWRMRHAAAERNPGARCC